MSEEKQEENSNLIINSNNNEENSLEKKENKRRRKELIDNDDEEDQNIKEEFEIIQNEETKEKDDIKISDNKENFENNKFNTLSKEDQEKQTKVNNNLILQEKLKKIFLNREKAKLKYTKQEIPDYLKYHSDDSDSFESTGLRKSKLLKRENNIIDLNNKNLIVNVSDKKYVTNNKIRLEEADTKINLEKYSKIKNDKQLEEDTIKINNENNIDLENNNNEIDNKIENIKIKPENINEKENIEIKNDLIKSHDEEIIKTEEINHNENKIKNKESPENKKNNLIIEISPKLIPQKDNDYIIKSNSINENEIKKVHIQNNEELNLKRGNENKEIEISIFNLESKKEEKGEFDIMNNNKISKNINKNNNYGEIKQNEKTKDLFKIIGQLKKKKSESVCNKKKLEVIRYPNEQRNQNNYNNNINKNISKKRINNLSNDEIDKEEAKIKKNKNVDLNKFLTKKESHNIYQKNKEIQTIELSPKNKKINNSYSSKGIPHVKYIENKINKLSNNIPIPKISEFNRYKSSQNENSIEIDLNTTPSSHLDKSFDAINNKTKNSLNVYRPKKVVKKISKIKDKNNYEKNNIVPNQNIIYNNFNNFFNSSEIYGNGNKNIFKKKNFNTYNENSIENCNRNYLRKENTVNKELYFNQENNNCNNNNVDSYYQNLNKRNCFDEKKIFYSGINENNIIDNMPINREINFMSINQNDNRNLVFNNFYKNENVINKSYGNIFNGYNNNVFDNNYIGNEYFGNLSTKNNLIQNPKFITYNILNPNPSYNNNPIRTVLNTSNPNNDLYIIQNRNNNNIPCQKRYTNKNTNCIYSNKYNHIYPRKNSNTNTNLYNSNLNNNNHFRENIQQVKHEQNKMKRNTSINIEDLLVLEEKMSEISFALNKNGFMHYECFEFWNYYYNCSLFGQLEKLFKTQNEQSNVKISINYILVSIMICYDYSYEIEILNGDYSLLEEILKLNHKTLIIIYEHILSKISSVSKTNIWVFKLRDLINNFNSKTNNNDYFANASQMTSIEKIIYNTSAIIQNIRVLLKNYKTQNITYLTNIFKKISEKTYEEIDTYFRENIFRVDNLDGSVLASVFLKENQNFKTEPAPYICTRNRKPFSLILDLDETLIHFKIKNENDSEGVLQIRPGVIPFLEKVGKFYELIVFTAATQDYGDLLIDAIEENNVYFEHRFYRQHTIIIGNDFVKDLTRIGRPLDKIIIVDNMPQNFRLQKENGINIKAFWGEDVDDNALEELGIILINIAKDGGDVRKGLEKYKDEIIRKVTSNMAKSDYY